MLVSDQSRTLERPHSKEPGYGYGPETIVATVFSAGVIALLITAMIQSHWMWWQILAVATLTAIGLVVAFARETKDEPPSIGSVCSECFRPIRWIKCDGRPIALDREPRPDGNVEILYDEGNWPYARWLTNDRRAELKLQAHAATRNGDSLPLNFYVRHTCQGGNR